MFPALPDAAPLTYTLLLKACLSPVPKDRPSFKHMQQIFTDMRKEMMHDHYVDSTGSVQARALFSSVLSSMHARPCSSTTSALFHVRLSERQS